ncbi:hypothetical protein CSIV_12425 [Microbacterium sp. CSI-V]|uniref:hypothetical protein n=1 Tax=unclassified Microbacterium TaxID=2609290 RepID=UPI00097C1295|nr:MULTISPECIES: hypothetical protein [unclassified Microbacterium]MXS73682.1 hypothetical protein [Microbacterium sp. TL13]ONI62315.1 hypothetical protein CSIV_12425 [Microbacterium sp. CSI-V]
MTTNNGIRRARSTHLVAALLDLGNVPAAVVDRAADDLSPDIATDLVFMASEHAAMTRAGDYLDKARARARAAGDRRPVALAYGSDRQTGRIEPLVLMTAEDFARLVARVADAEEVAA